MAELEMLQQVLKGLAGIDEHNFALSANCWQHKELKKGEFYNEHRNICKYLGFIMEGVFRSYYIDGKTGDEKNVFFFTEHQLVVAFKSFVTQTPCSYYTQALSPAKILWIHTEHLSRLYQQSHQWERFGRLVAEQAFNIAMTKAESFMFQTPEERYLDLINDHPRIFEAVPLYHLSSYLGIQGPSLSRIRKRLSGR